MDRPDNTSPLHTATHENLNKVRSFMMDLLEGHILNNMSASLIDIQEKLLNLSTQAINNNHKLSLLETRQVLENRKTTIIESFKKKLGDTTKEKKKDALHLLKNKDLEKQIIAQESSKSLTDSRSSLLLSTINNRLQHHHDLYQLVSPIHIYVCFEKAISDVCLPKEMEAICLQAFCHCMRPHITTLYENTDVFLENSGFSVLTSFTKSETNENQLLDNITNKVINKSSYTLAEQNMCTERHSSLLTPADLVTTLSILQVELLSTFNAIEDLSESIKFSLEHQGIYPKLSCRHQDLINLTGMLFEFILDDHQLHNDIRKLIALLQIPLLKLAIFDATFLTDRHHPARDLLNEMTAAGMAYSNETLKDEALIRLIERTVKTIVSHTNDNSIFPLALNRFRDELQTLTTFSNDPLPPDEPPEVKRPEVTLSNAEAGNNAGALKEIQPVDEDEDKNEDESTLTTDNDLNQNLEEIILESGARGVEPFSLHDSDETINIKAFQPFAGLAENQWVEFIGESKNSFRCKLSDIDTLHNRYTFINSSGMKVAEKSSEELQSDFEKGTLRILEDSPLFDRALRNVIDKFLRY
ncbi:DUF1631 family protein [Candidatus Sororendozoicomonas aggregata]|uniref:DUF1631 family protein n=1 Tax=Candidatus Sororendozoicomonas aggregata TaxID=3073239 RepID=UPI002ED56F8F